MNKPSFPSEGRLAGIDFGTVRIGIAVSDAGQRIASPLENYQRVGLQGDALHFRQLVEQEAIVAFVVGLPVHSSGDESEKSREARRFGEWLQQETHLPVTYFDERYTTVQAEQILGQAGLTKKRRRGRLDMLAAQILLAAFLESNREHTPGPLGD